MDTKSKIAASVTRVEKAGADPIEWIPLTPLAEQPPEETSHFIMAFIEWKREVITSVEELRADIERALHGLSEV